MYIIWYAILLHYMWSILLLVEPSTANITAINKINVVFGGNTVVTALFIFSIATLALYGLLKHEHYHYLNNYKTIFFIIPQQCLMMFTALGAVCAVYYSTFADGIVRPRCFIAADQFPSILSCLLHTIAIIDSYSSELR
jgi:hypothetical protein